METKYLDNWKKELDICIRCGYCFEKCPVFKVLGWESDTARGKAILAYGLLNGEIVPSQTLADKFFQCTFCKDCVETCSANVPIGEVFTAARADMIAAGYAHDAHNYMVESVQKTGNIFNDPELKAPVSEGNITVYLGCQYLGRGNLTKTYLNILRKLGFEPRVKEEICCGNIMKTLGFLDEFEEQKKRFVEKFPEEDIVTLCPTCNITLKEDYGKNVKHILEVIADKIPEANLETKVTYHDPCDMSRELNIMDQPRAILEKIGVEIIEMPRNRKNSSCCGGGGGILSSDAELSGRIAEGRIREAAATGADTLVTSCPTCEKTLKEAAMNLKKAGEDTVSVRNICQLISKAIK